MSHRDASPWLMVLPIQQHRVFVVPLRLFDSLTPPLLDVQCLVTFDLHCETENAVEVCTTHSALVLVALYALAGSIDHMLRPLCRQQDLLDDIVQQVHDFAFTYLTFLADVDSHVSSED